MHHDLESKSKRGSHVLPKELKAKRRRDTSEVNTRYVFDIVKKAKVDKGAREAKSEQEFKDSIQMAFK